MATKESTYKERFQRLRDIIGGPKVRGAATANQVYARYQDGLGDVDDTGGMSGTGVITPSQFSYWPSGRQEHWGLAPMKLGIDFHHPHGGGPMYMSGVLDEVAPGFINDITHMFDSPDGTDLKDIFRNTLNTIADRVYSEGPVEFGALRMSVSLVAWEED